MRSAQQVGNLFKRGPCKAREAFGSDHDHSPTLELALGHEFLCQKAIGGGVFTQREELLVGEINGHGSSPKKKGARYTVHGARQPH